MRREERVKSRIRGISFHRIEAQSIIAYKRSVVLLLMDIYNNEYRLILG